MQPVGNNNPIIFPEPAPDEAAPQVHLLNAGQNIVLNGVTVTNTSQQHAVNVSMAAGQDNGEAILNLTATHGQHSVTHAIYFEDGEVEIDALNIVFDADGEIDIVTPNEQAIE